MQRYLFGKESMPMEMDFAVSDMLDLINPSFQRADTCEAADAFVALAEGAVYLRFLSHSLSHDSWRWLVMEAMPSSRLHIKRGHTKPARLVWRRCRLLPLPSCTPAVFYPHTYMHHYLPTTHGRAARAHSVTFALIRIFPFTRLRTITHARVHV